MPVLDAAPPPASQPEPSLEGLAGQSGMPPGAEAASLQATVAQKLAMADKLMQEASTIMPNLAGVMDDLRNQMRQRSASIVFSSAPAPAAPQGGGMMGMMG